MTLTEQYALACLPTLLAARAERIDGGLISMTKRYLESLPEDEQDEILGAVDADGLEVEYEDKDDIPDSNDEPIYGLKPGLKRCAYILRSGHQCQLAEGHDGRHAWEQEWVKRVAAEETK